MSKSRIIPVVVEEFTRRGWQHFGEWKNKTHGAPTTANLEKFRKVFIASTQAGGCNEHLGPTNTGNLRIRRVRDNAVLASFTAPMFEVVQTI